MSKEKIDALITSGTLVVDSNPLHIKNASYSISVGKIFKPDQGTEVTLGTQPSAGKSWKFWSRLKSIQNAEINHFFKVHSGEIVVVMSKEKIKLPAHICASYNPTFAISRKGLSLINNSIIEPGYEGHLSCIFANFSKNTAKLVLDEPIVKLVFFELAANDDDTSLSNTKTETIDADAYTQLVAQIASDFHKTFLDIETLEDRVKEKASQAVKKQVVWGGVMIAVLLLWATLQPLISKWIYLNDTENTLTLKGELIERLMKLERRDSLEKIRPIRSDSLK